MNRIALAEHEHSRACFLSERTCHISMIILCCNITKFNTEVVLLLSVSPLSLFFFSHSDLILLRDSQILLPTSVGNNHLHVWLVSSLVLHAGHFSGW